MNKDKLVKCEKYLSDLNNRKGSPVPEKHKDHPAEYQRFLENEIRLVKLTIEGMKQ